MCRSSPPELRIPWPCMLAVPLLCVCFARKGRWTRALWSDPACLLQRPIGRPGPYRPPRPQTPIPSSPPPPPLPQPHSRTHTSFPAASPLTEACPVRPLRRCARRALGLAMTARRPRCPCRTGVEKDSRTIGRRAGRSTTTAAGRACQAWGARRHRQMQRPYPAAAAVAVAAAAAKTGTGTGTGTTAPWLCVSRLALAATSRPCGSVAGSPPTQTVAGRARPMERQGRGLACLQRQFEGPSQVRIEGMDCAPCVGFVADVGGPA